MISARPLSPSANWYRRSLAIAFMRSPTVPFVRPRPFMIASICDCSWSSSLWPIAWTSSGVMVVVVDAFSAHGRIRRHSAAPTCRHRLLATGALVFELGDLAVERRRDLLRRDRRWRARTSCRESSWCAAQSIRPASRPRARSSPTRASATAPCRSGNAGGTRPLPRAAWMRPSSPSSCFAYDCSRARYASASARVLDRMIAVEESRHIEIGADVLDHHVRRVAPAADGDVAIRQRKAFERRRVRAAHDLDARARRMRGRCCRTPWRDPDPAAPGRRSSSVRRPIDRPAAIAAPPARRCRCRARSRSPARSAGSSRRFDRATPVRPSPHSQSLSLLAAADGVLLVHPFSSGSVAVDARAAMASRRFIRS